MLINFSVKNFLSFKEEVSFTFNAASIKEHPDHVFEMADGRYNLLNGALLYGANGSGKSNFISALSFVKDFAINSFKNKQAKEKIDIDEFRLSTDTLNKPSRFEIEILIDDTKYRYGFIVDKVVVSEEWLYVSHKIKEYPLFQRVFDSDSDHYNYDVNPRFKETDSADPELTRKNSLFLSMCAQLNGKTSIKIIEWFQKATFVSGTNYMEYVDYTANLLNTPRQNEVMLRILKKANLGFSKVRIIKNPMTEEMLSGLPKELKSLILSSNSDALQVKTHHNKYDHLGNVVANDVEFDLMRDESLGTQKFFALLGPIYNSLLNGSLLIIDELDARLHTNLSRLIIEFYQSAFNNPNKSQFLFATHNTQFMDKTLFRRDQLFLIDKTKNESSFLYNIFNMSKFDSDLPSVRNDASFEKEYLEGKYGAVPFDQTAGRNLHIWDLMSE